MTSETRFTQWPVYDCGDPDCAPCQRAFGPDRSDAIARYEKRAAIYALPYEERRKALMGTRRQAGGGAGQMLEKSLQTSRTSLSKARGETS